MMDIGYFHHKEMLNSWKAKYVHPEWLLHNVHM